jgi:parallel beta-helix repeat protein
LAIALVAVLGVSTAAAIPGPARQVAPGGVDSGDCTVAPCETIQYAVDQAVDGDTVDVAAGIYDEPQVIVDKPLTLQGAGAGQTIVDGSSASGLPTNGLFRFDSPAVGDISVSGFTLQGANGDNGGGEALLMLFSGVPTGSQVSVTENELLASEALDPDIATDWSLGIYVSSSAAAIEVEDNLFDGMWQGILVERSTGSTTIAGNEFADMVSNIAGPDTFPGEGILILAVGDAVTSPQLVSDNYFHGYAGLGVAVQAGHSSAPIAQSSFSDVTVAGNQIDLGGAMFPSTGRPLAGVILKTGQAQSTIEGADILGNTISVSAPGNDVAVESGVSETEAHLNRLTGDPSAGLDAFYASGPVSAADNWWGCNEGPGSPQCTTVSGDVDSAPNLVLSGTASSPQVEPGQSATITASLAANSDGGAVSGVPAGGSPVTFDSSLGSMAPATAPLFEGSASSTFIAGAQLGQAGATVSLDNQPVSVPLSVVAPPASQPTPPASTTPSPASVGSPPVIKPSLGEGPKSVPANGQVTVANVSCPSGSCEVAAKSPSLTIGGKAYKVTVKAPRKVAAGDSAPIRIVLSKAARAALAKEGKGRCTVKVTVTSSTGEAKTVTVTVKLTSKSDKHKDQ